MSYYALVKKSVANSAGAATEIHDALVTNMGWTLHDDQSAASPPYYVFSSKGENEDKPRVYMQVRWGNVADRIEFYMYLHWDSTAHSGTVSMGGTYFRLTVDDDSAFLLWIYGDKNSYVIMSKVGTAYTGTSIDYIDSYYKGFGTIASAVTAGSNVVLQLGAGEAADFIVGETYQVVGSGAGEGRERTEITAVNVGSDQVTVDSLTRALSVDSTIARIAFPWVNVAYTPAERLIGCINDHEGTSDETIRFTNQATILGDTVDPNAITGKHDFWRVGVQESNTAPYGILMYTLHIYFSATGYEDTIGVDQVDSGTSTGSNTSTTLNDTGKSWTANEWANYCLILTSGTNVGEMREIVSNTTTELTVAPAWTVSPDNTTGYVITKKGYRYFPMQSSTRSFACKEIDGGV